MSYNPPWTAHADPTGAAIQNPPPLGQFPVAPPSQPASDIWSRPLSVTPNPENLPAPGNLGLPSASLPEFAAPFESSVVPGQFPGAPPSLNQPAFDQPLAVPDLGVDFEDPRFFEPADPRVMTSIPDSYLGRVQWRVSNDYTHFYSRDTFIDLGIVAAVAATLANTKLDEECRDLFLDNITNTGNGGASRFLHQMKGIGNGKKTLPIFAIAAIAGHFSDEVPILEPVGDWGSHSLRVFLVGGPVVAAGQMITGGSRPGEMSHGSAWRPFSDNNGVSGHAFMGAIPFLAASELTDRRDLKTVLILGSTITGLSRINDDDHYTSQVVLGWTIAYLAHRAASQTDQDERAWRLTGWQSADAQGLGFIKRW